MQIKTSLIQGFLFITLVTFLIACGTAPRSKEFENFNGAVESAHDYVRIAQRDTHDGHFAKAQAVTDSLNQKTGKSSCYRILSASTQWGIFEPEIVFQGEDVISSSIKAFIFVPPLLDKTYFPNPAEEPNLKVFRIDQDAPYAHKLISLLNGTVGHNELCVKFATVPRDEDQDAPVIAATVLPIVLANAVVTKPASPPPAPVPAAVSTPAPSETSKPTPADQDKKPGKKKTKVSSTKQN